MTSITIRNVPTYQSLKVATGNQKPHPVNIMNIPEQTPEEKKEDEATIHKEKTPENPLKITRPLAGKHRKSNLNLNDPKIEFLQSQLDSCRGIIAQREAELKKIKESDTLKTKRIMQLDAQLQEATNLINKTSSTNPVPVEPIMAQLTPNLQSSSHENSKILILENKTTSLEIQLTTLSSKLDTIQTMFILGSKTKSCPCAKSADEQHSPVKAQTDVNQQDETIEKEQLTNNQTVINEEHQKCVEETVQQ